MPETINPSAELAYIKKLRNELTDFFEKLSATYSTEQVIDEVMILRQYTSDKMRKTLKDLGIFKLNAVSDLLIAGDETTYATYADWNIVRSDGYSMLAGRYIFPVRDFSGKVTALVGWAPRDPKYLVTPTRGFVKDAQFFGAECYLTYTQRKENTVYLAEGFFDAISLRSEGFCALSNFGLTLSAVKSEMLRRFGKVVVISDADAAGRRPFPYIDGDARTRAKQWHISNPTTFTQIRIPGIKDVDDLIRLYDCLDDIYNLRYKGPIAYLTDSSAT